MCVTVRGARMSVVDELADGLEKARRRSLELLRPLPEEALVAQYSDLMSPLVWDLAHIGNYEDLWLVRQLGGPAVLPAVDELYDAFLQPRARRPALPLLSPAETRQYIARVRGRCLDLLSAADLGSEDPFLAGGFGYRMVIQHEHQHNETMLATLQLSGIESDYGGFESDGLGWAKTGESRVPAATFVMGTDTDPWALDNERPAHSVHLDDYFIDARPVDNEAWMEFMEAGGYEENSLWSPDGWAWKSQEQISAPLFWERDGGGVWKRRHLGRATELRPNDAVQNVGWYEAEAFARWAGRRLPTEQEWERAHRAGLIEGVGEVWEWTSSDFLPYPGFRPFPYREYSEVFFGKEYKVLRGSSWATHATVGRPTFRNWDYPVRRQIFSGLRTARDG
ncbi:MAG: ergothioneine biosynthesis protein EgtB [Actinobacteria bacterium]|nr:ergothioneine biosynthesis protein EgtB [Actinomycetota bacterium]